MVQLLLNSKLAVILGKTMFIYRLTASRDDIRVRCILISPTQALICHWFYVHDGRSFYSMFPLTPAEITRPSPPRRAHCVFIGTGTNGRWHAQPATTFVSLDISRNI